ncbi:unnamed protein product [Protopolystoma xenopodis]|uniref:Protein kinase domain-containing protein n=1 Tax=Protopolystoma xenopodis TaxID=117903 RepID=A0A3S5CGW4_9PLAT|nr:unnamed protein product [Protopolystoma xenopodis]
MWYRSPEILLGAQRYSCGVDIWSMGCIFSEVATKEALFRGDSEIDQLFRIFRCLGTPTEETWKGVSQLPEYKKKSFPAWKRAKLSEQENIANAFDKDGIDLLQSMLVYEPARRINARDALLHPYFSDLDKSIVPAAGEEYVGLPLHQLPNEVARLFIEKANETLQIGSALTHRAGVGGDENLPIRQSLAGTGPGKLGQSTSKLSIDEKTLTAGANALPTALARTQPGHPLLLAIDQVALPTSLAGDASAMATSRPLCESSEVNMSIS